MKIASILLTALLSAGNLLAQEAAPVSPAAMKNWQDARFGMFIHWGPVSLKGTEIGWSRGAQVPIEEYDNLYKQFNPTKFNADEWVTIAKAAGMKYIVLTTKHHDGFCLWDTKQTDHNIMNTPFKRDVVKELAAACKKGGIAFGAYYSTCDWHHPDFPLTSPGGSVERATSNLDRYTDYLKAQTKELLTNYGPLFTIWYDVPQKFDAVRGAGVINMARAIQPSIVINNRTGDRGDYDTPEQVIGGFQINRPWETCMTICEQWAWKPDDTMKSLKDCVQTLIRSNGGDGNLLFNVGPMPTGEIEARQVVRLKEMGAWVSKNSTAIYGTRGGPLKPTAHIVSTRKGDKIYLHLLEKEDGPVTIPVLPNTIKAAKLLNGPNIKLVLADGTIAFKIPDGSWDPIDTIVELTVDGDAMTMTPLNPLRKTNLVGAKASASAYYENDAKHSPDMVLDGQTESRWAAPLGTAPSWLQIDFAKETTFKGIKIEEAIFEVASRVQKFELQKKDGDTWTTFFTGTDIGPKFSTTFAPITTRAIRLNILAATNGPTISEISIQTP